MFVDKLNNNDRCFYFVLSVVKFVVLLISAPDSIIQAGENGG